MAKPVYKNGKVVYELTESEKQAGAKAAQNAYTETQQKNLITATQQQATKLSSSSAPKTTAESVDLTKTMNSYEANLKRLNALGYDVSEQTSAVDKLKQQRKDYLAETKLIKTNAPKTQPVQTPGDLARKNTQTLLFDGPLPTMGDALQQTAAVQQTALSRMQAEANQQAKKAAQERLAALDLQIKGLSADYTAAKQRNEIAGEELPDNADTIKRYNDLSAERDRLSATINIYEREQEVFDKYADTFRNAKTSKLATDKGTGTASKAKLKSAEPGSLKLDSIDRLGAYLNSSVQEREKAIQQLSGAGSVYGNVMLAGDDGGWDQLREDEVDAYYFLLNTQGYGAANSFLDEMKIILNKRQVEAKQAKIDSATGLQKFGMNLAAIPAGIVGGTTALLGSVGDALHGEPFNPYSASFGLTNFSKNVTEVTAADLNELTNNKAILGVTLGDAYQAAVSGVTSLVGATTMGPAYSAVMGMNSAVSKAQELYERGATNQQIAAGALLSGAAELVFEKYSIENFLNQSNPETVLGLVKNVLQQGFVEGSEETFTEIANIISDTLVMGGQSEWNLLVAKYVAEGNDPSTASAKAMWDMASQVYKSAAGGFISGALMGGMGSTVSYATNHSRVSSIGSAVRNSETGDEFALITAAQQTFKPGSEGRDLADQLDAKRLRGEELSNYDLGKLYLELVSETRRQATERFTTEELEALGKQAQSTNPEVAEHAVAQLRNPEATVVSPIAEKLISAGVRANIASEQSDILIKLSTGTELTSDEVKNLYFTSPAVRQVFTQLTGVEVPQGAVSTSWKKDICKQAVKQVQQQKTREAEVAARTAAAETEARVAAEAAQAVETPVDAPAAPVAAPSVEPVTPVMEQPVVQNTAPAAPVQTEAPVEAQTEAPVEAQTDAPNRAVSEQALAQILEQAVASGENALIFEDGTSMTEGQFVDNAMRANRGMTEAEAKAQFKMYRSLNAMGKGMPGTASSNLNRDSLTAMTDAVVKARNEQRSRRIGEVEITRDIDIAAAEKTIQWLNNLGKERFGVTVQIGDLGGNKNAEYDSATKTITIDRRVATSQYLVTYFFVHEVTHASQDADANLTKDLLEVMKQMRGEKYVKRITAETRKLYEAAYKAEGRTIQQKDIDEEVAANFLMDVIGNRKQLDLLTGTRPRIVRRFLAHLENFLSGRPKTEKQGHKELNKLIDRMRGSLERTANEKTAPEGGKRNALADVQRDLTAAYHAEVDTILSGAPSGKSAVVMGYTPEIYQKLGMPSLPFVIGKGHIYSIAKTEAEAQQDAATISPRLYSPSVHYHGLGANAVKNLYTAAQKPIMIIAAKDVDPKAEPLRSTHSIVAIVDVGSAEKSLLLPIELTAERTVDGAQMEVNVLSSAYHKNVANLVTEAIAQENIGEIGVYYVTTKAASLPVDGVQFPSHLAAATASDGIVRLFDEKVNLGIEKNTQSIQFKRWFGDWQNNPEKASVVVDEQGEPLAVYHGTDSDIEEFKPEFTGKGNDQYGSGYYFTTSEETAGQYASGENANVIPAFLNIRRPLVLDSQQTPNLYEVDVTARQATQILLKHPDILSEENSILGDFFEEYWETGPSEGLVRRLAKEYNWTLGSLETDLFRDYPEAFHTAVRDVLHYDGVQVNFPDGSKHYVAWFPNQIKHATENVGTFSTKDNRIRYSLSPTSETEHDLHDAYDLSHERTGYANVPDSLMGFVGSGKTNKGFENENYPYTLKLWVSVDGGYEFWKDEIKGMNRKHALERARRNWSDDGGGSVILKDRTTHKNDGWSGGTKRFSLSPDTGYEEGTIQDRTLKLLQTGTLDEAVELLQKWAEDVRAGKVDVRKEEEALRDQMLKAEPVTPEEAEANRDKLNKLIEKYGEIKPGMNRARPVFMPKMRTDNLAVSQFARSLAEAEGTPAWFKEEVERAVVNGDWGFTHTIYTDKAAMQHVETAKANGFERSLATWNALVDTKGIGGLSTGMITKGDIALGEWLYMETVKAGDIAGATKIAAELAAIGTQAGQIVQAMSLIKKMTPEGQLHYLMQAVDRMNNQAKRKANKKTKSEKQQAKELEEKRAKAETELYEAQKQLDEKNQKLEELQTTLADLTAKRTDLKDAESEVKRAEKRLERLQSEWSQVAADTVQEELRRAMKDLDEARGRKEEHRRNGAKLMRAKAALEKLKGAWDQAAADAVMADLESTNADIAHLREMIREFRKTEKALERAQERLSKLNTEWRTYAPKHKANEAELAKVKEEIDSAKEQRWKCDEALRQVEQEIKKLNKGIEERNDRRFRWQKPQKLITINQHYAEQLLNAKTQKEIDEAMDKLTQDIADQIPNTFVEMWNAWRYLSMLGNVRTHGRNFFSNAVMTPVTFFKDMVGVLPEVALSRDNKTKHLGQAFASLGYGLTIGTVKASKYTKFAAEDAKRMKDILTGGGKHNPSDMIRDKRKPFGRNKLLNALYKANSDLLEWEDWLFINLHYNRALSQYLAAHKADLDTIEQTESGRELLAKAREWAIQEAHKATFRDASQLATALSQLERSGLAGQLIVGGVMPFKKTPINILKRGVEYSPLGIITATTKALRNDSSAEEFVDGLASSLTGTAIMWVGLVLFRQGLLRAGGADDEKEREFEELRGMQAYSLQLLNGKNYTLDWAAPAALPLFIGAEIGKLMENGELSYKNLGDVMMLMAEPMFQMTMLDSLNSTLKGTGYSNNPSMNLISNVVLSYFGQGVPTIFGQVARILDPYRRSTYIEADSKMPKWLDRFWQSSVQSKTPIYAEGRAMYIDAWGRAETQGTVGNRIFSNMISPGYADTYASTPMEDELLRLYKVTGDATVLPRDAAKYFTLSTPLRYDPTSGQFSGGKGKRYNLSQDEWSTYQTVRGQTAYQLLTDLTNSAEYLAMTDDQKLSAVKKLWDYADAKGRESAVSKYKDNNSWIAKADALAERGLSVVDSVLFNVLEADSDEDFKTDLMSMEWLTDAEKGEVLAMTKMMTLEKDLTIADPAKTKYEFILTEPQMAEYLKKYDEIWKKEYEATAGNAYYTKLSDEAKVEFLTDLEANVTKQAQAWAVKTLKAAGVKSTESPTFDNLALRNCSEQDEIVRLYDATGKSSVLPSDAPANFTSDGKAYNLTAEQALKYREQKETTQNQLLSATVKGAAYKGMDNEQKVSTVSKLYTYANELAREKSAPGYKADTAWVTKAKELSAKGVKAETYIAQSVLCSDSAENDILDRINMDFLSDNDRGQIIAAEYTKKLTGNTFSDPNKKNHVFDLTDAQVSDYEDYYNELWMREYLEMVSSNRYIKADPEDKAEMTTDLRGEVADDTKDWMARQLRSMGIKSRYKG